MSFRLLNECKDLEDGDCVVADHVGATERLSEEQEDQECHWKQNCSVKQFGDSCWQGLVLVFLVCFISFKCLHFLLTLTVRHSSQTTQIPLSLFFSPSKSSFILTHYFEFRNQTLKAATLESLEGNIQELLVGVVGWPQGVLSSAMEAESQGCTWEGFLCWQQQASG